MFSEIVQLPLQAKHGNLVTPSTRLLRPDKSGNYKGALKAWRNLSFTIKAVQIRQGKLKQSLNKSG